MFFRSDSRCGFSPQDQGGLLADLLAERTLEWLMYFKKKYIFDTYYEGGYLPTGWLWVFDKYVYRYCVSSDAWRDAPDVQEVVRTLSICVH